MDVDPNENDDGTYCIARSSTDFTLLILHTMMKVVQKDNSSLYLVLSYVHQDVLYVLRVVLLMLKLNKKGTL